MNLKFKSFILGLVFVFLGLAPAKATEAPQCGEGQHFEGSEVCTGYIQYCAVLSEECVNQAEPAYECPEGYSEIEENLCQQQTSTDEILFEDNFNSTLPFDFFGWSEAEGSWNESSSNDRAEINGDTGSNDDELRKDISTVNYENIILSYSYRADNLESSDEVKVQWSDGSTWNTLFTIDDDNDDDQWHNKSHNLPTGANNNPDFKIRFDADLNNSNDEVYLDNVKLEADGYTYAEKEEIPGQCLEYACQEYDQYCAETEWQGQCVAEQPKPKVQNTGGCDLLCLAPKLGEVRINGRQVNFLGSRFAKAGIVFDAKSHPFALDMFGQPIPASLSVFVQIAAQYIPNYQYGYQFAYETDKYAVYHSFDLPSFVVPGHYFGRVYMFGEQDIYGAQTLMPGQHPKLKPAFSQEFEFDIK